MQKQFIILVSAFVAVALISFTTYHTDNFVVDVNSSSVSWLAKKVTGQHNGTVKLKSGSLAINHGTPVGGTFELDMTSITCTDITDPKKNQDLVSHLKNDDFFSVEKFPSSQLTITRFSPAANVQPGSGTYEAWGNLTIKGITQPVQFTTKITGSGRQIQATAKITIDRTKWNISYKSGTVFPELVDKAIADNVEFSVSIVANAQH